MKLKVEKKDGRITKILQGFSSLKSFFRKPKRKQHVAGQMTFFEHLGELRNRIIFSCLGVIITSILGFMNSNDLYNIFADLAKPQKLVTFQAFDQFGIFMNISIYFGLLLASPIIVYNILAFLAPALEPESMPGTPEYVRELNLSKSVKRSLWFFIPFVAVSFAAGIAFAYYLVIPPALHFLLNFSHGQIESMLDAQKFIGFVTKILFSTGVVFELPIFLFLLAKIRVVTYKRLIKWWKYALVFSLVAAAFITPSPDIVYQSLIALPIYGLYWLGILLARFA